MPVDTQRFFARKPDGRLLHVEAQPLFWTSPDWTTASDTVNEQRGWPGQPAQHKQDLSNVAKWNVKETSFDAYVTSLRQQIKEEEADERSRLAWQKYLELAGVIIDAASWCVPPARIALFVEILGSAIKFTVKAGQILLADDQLKAVKEVAADIVLSACLSKSYDFLVLKRGSLEPCPVALNTKWKLDGTAAEASLLSCDMIKLGVSYSKDPPSYVAPSTFEFERAMQFRYHADSKYKASVDGFNKMVRQWSVPPVIENAQVKTSDNWYSVKLKGSNLGMLSDVMMTDIRGSSEFVRCVPSYDSHNAEFRVPLSKVGQRTIVGFSLQGGFSNGYPVVFK